MHAQWHAHAPFLENEAQLIVSRNSCRLMGGVVNLWQHDVQFITCILMTMKRRCKSSAQGCIIKSWINAPFCINTDTGTTCYGFPLCSTGKETPYPKLARIQTHPALTNPSKLSTMLIKNALFVLLLLLSIVVAAPVGTSRESSPSDVLLRNAKSILELRTRDDARLSTKIIKYTDDKIEE